MRGQHLTEAMMMAATTSSFTPANPRLLPALFPHPRSGMQIARAGASQAERHDVDQPTDTTRGRGPWPRLDPDWARGPRSGPRALATPASSPRSCTTAAAPPEAPAHQRHEARQTAQQGTRPELLAQRQRR
jgi:hypothetical protein